MQQKNQQGGFLFGFIVGLIISLGAAAAIAWKWLPMQKFSDIVAGKGPSQGIQRPVMSTNTGLSDEQPVRGEQRAMKESTATFEKETPRAEHTSYLVQAGAFRDENEAQQRRAQLAMLGIESKIVADKASSGLHVVQIGPFTDAAPAHATESALEASGIKAFTTRKSE